jgi:hypothetical protein
VKTWTAQDQAIAEQTASQLSLKAYGDASDGLRQALSYAKTWEPPADVNSGPVPLAEFARRARELADIAEKWAADAAKTEQAAK